MQNVAVRPSNLNTAAFVICAICQFRHQGWSSCNNAFQLAKDMLLLQKGWEATASHTKFTPEGIIPVPQALKEGFANVFWESWYALACTPTLQAVLHFTDSGPNEVKSRSIPIGWCELSLGTSLCSKNLFTFGWRRSSTLRARFLTLLMGFAYFATTGDLCTGFKDHLEVQNPLHLDGRKASSKVLLLRNRCR